LTVVKRFVIFRFDYSPPLVDILILSIEAELACGQVLISLCPREACGSPGGARRQPGVELPGSEAIVGVARSSRQPWAEHERISPAPRRRAPRALGEARRRGHHAPHAVVRPPPGPAPRRLVADRRSPPPRPYSACALVEMHRTSLLLGPSSALPVTETPQQSSATAGAPGRRQTRPSPSCFTVSICLYSMLQTCVSDVLNVQEQCPNCFMLMLQNKS
jgi:hypothetical protein